MFYIRRDRSDAVKKQMRMNTINRTICLALLSLIGVAISNNVVAQDPTEFGDVSKARFDSVARVYEAQDIKAQADRDKAVSEQKRSNAQNLSDLKDEKAATKSEAKEAQRVENDANDAAKESKTAYRREKKAQKARRQADKQAAKAEKARVISDKNKD